MLVILVCAQATAGAVHIGYGLMVVLASAVAGEASASTVQLPPGTSTVEITLTAIPQGTRVSIEHRDLPPEEAAKHAIGWAHFLRRLTDAAIGHDPGPDPFAQTIPKRPSPSEDATGQLAPDR